MSKRGKYILTFSGGFVAGVVASFLFLFVLATIHNGKKYRSPDKDPDIVLFENPGQEIKANTFEVIQVFPNGNALAQANELSNKAVSYGTVVLFLAEDGVTYYDDQIISKSRRQKVVQIGTYKYESKLNVIKTVPVVKIKEK